MPKLPTISGKDLVKMFSKLGYDIDHQTGSHIILRNRNPPHRRLTIPNHARNCKRNTTSNTVSSRINKRSILYDDISSYWSFKWCWAQHKPPTKNK